jgi:hypothetical protein
VIEITDEPARVPVRVRKMFIEPIDTSDVSGFVFTVRRSDGRFDDEVVTGVDGLTDPIALTIGDYETCETATPDWASEYADAGCIHFGISLGDLGRTDPPVYQYLNIVPTTTTTTTSTTVSPTTTTSPPTTFPPSQPVDQQTTTTTAAPTVDAMPPVASTTTTLAAPRPLPRTGGGAGKLLDLADIGFLAGVAMIAITGLLPRRPGRETAGR